MAFEGQIPVRESAVAGANLEDIQFSPLTLDSTGQLVLANLTTEVFFGVLTNKPRSGEHASSALTGLSKAIAGATITLGTYVAVQSATFISAVSGGLGVGKAWNGVASGGIFTVVLMDAPHLLATSLQ